MKNIYQILELQKEGNVYSCISSTLKWMPSKTLTRSLFGGICLYGLFPFCKKEGLKVCRVLYYEPFKMEEKAALKGPLYKIRGEDLDLKLFLCAPGKLHIFFAHIIVAFIFLVLRASRHCNYGGGRSLFSFFNCFSHCSRHEFEGTDMRSCSFITSW